MKIRHKQSGVVLEGQFVSMGECGNGVSRNYYYPAQSTHNSGSEYSMTEWELVRPEPKWVDVTSEIEVSDEQLGQFLTHNRIGMTTEIASGYRLRKVQVRIDGFPKYAFIVERKA